MVGGRVIWIGRGFVDWLVLAGGRRAPLGAAPGELMRVDRTVRSFFDRLALRPRAEKNPDVEKDGVSERREVGGEVLEELVFWRAGGTVRSAREGYGSWGKPGEVRSSNCPGLRSVAVVASSRRGNVASEMIDDRDVCRGCGTNNLDDGPRFRLGIRPEFY